MAFWTVAMIWLKIKLENSVKHHSVSAVQVFWKHFGEREIAHNKWFLLFHTVVFTYLENLLPFSSNLKLSSAKSFSLEESKICRLGKG